MPNLMAYCFQLRRNGGFAGAIVFYTETKDGALAAVSDFCKGKDIDNVILMKTRSLNEDELATITK